MKTIALVTLISLKKDSHFFFVCRLVHTKVGIHFIQSYEIKSPPWIVLWFRILGIFSVESIDRLGAMKFQTLDNSQLCIDLQYSSQQLAVI